MNQVKNIMPKSSPKAIAIIGAGLAGITAARTLAQSGHQVTVFEKSRGLGGRMSSRRSDFGRFDHGAQYFTARDPRFLQALDWVQTTAPGTLQPWQTRTEAKSRHQETRWIGVPGMNALATHIGSRLVADNSVHLETRVTRIVRTHNAYAGWSIEALGPNDQAVSVGSFDSVVLALPSEQTLQLLQLSKLQSAWLPAIDAVEVAPCWTLMLAFPEVLIDQSDRREKAKLAFGPQWHATHSEHKRVVWVARESSKPGRDGVERWVVQATPAWSKKHLEDNPERVQAKLLKAFAQITGIRAQPSHLAVHRWRYALTQKPLQVAGPPPGNSFLYDESTGIGVCGDWCRGHRVEDAFLSGLDLALALA
jgi:renalase